MTTLTRSQEIRRVVLAMYADGHSQPEIRRLTGFSAERISIIVTQEQLRGVPTIPDDCHKKLAAGIPLTRAEQARCDKAVADAMAALRAIRMQEAIDRKTPKQCGRPSASELHFARRGVKGSE